MSFINPSQVMPIKVENLNFVIQTLPQQKSLLWMKLWPCYCSKVFLKNILYNHSVSKLILNDPFVISKRYKFSVVIGEGYRAYWLHMIFVGLYDLFKSGVKLVNVTVSTANKKSIGLKRILSDFNAIRKFLYAVSIY